MGLRMASPTKREGSTFKQFRQRIPADVLAKARGMTLRVPVGAETALVRLGNGTASVKCSLRIRDPREAKERQAQALTYLDAVWRSERGCLERPRRGTGLGRAQHQSELRLAKL